MRWLGGMMTVASMTVALFGGGAATGEAAETAWTDLTVRVYDSARVRAVFTGEALDVAARTLSPASVNVTWVLCAGRSDSRDDGRCAAPPGRNEVIIRLIRSAKAAGSQETDTLGSALVDPHTGSGVLATVYVERVEYLARVAGADFATLLGRAMAHEIGHLLLGHGAHGVHGLMRPRWTRDEVQRNAGTDWGFAPPELVAIRASRAGASRR